MKLVKNNKLMKQKMKEYYYSDYYSLEDCYNICSTAKWRAFHYCEDLEKKYIGENLKIINFNTFSFSVCFIGVYNERPAFFYITKDNDRVCYLD